MADPGVSATSAFDLTNPWTAKNVLRLHRSRMTGVRWKTRSKNERMLALKNLRITAAIAVCMVALCPRFLEGQVLYGSILGSLQDPSGSAVPNATVTITNKETGQTRQTASDAQGSFNISNVLPGRYD